ncbi:MAG TPA: gluconokinase [Rhodanobacteraceae bacterium]|nr:gluconokinase [Rhodanobacteraceae bacterium]
MSDPAPPRLLVIMGVSGCGKTSVGRRLAGTLDWPFMEGDELHSPANVAKMAAGIPLEDSDRWPWLHSVAAWLDDQLAAGEHGVVACSALKRSYRELLCGGRPSLRFVYLCVERAELERRLAQRRGHYMPATLLDSQLATLQEPAEDEPALTIDANGSIDETVVAVLQAVRGEC